MAGNLKTRLAALEAIRAKATQRVRVVIARGVSDNGRLILTPDGEWVEKPEGTRAIIITTVTRD